MRTSTKKEWTVVYAPLGWRGETLRWEYRLTFRQAVRLCRLIKQSRNILFARVRRWEET